MTGSCSDSSWPVDVAAVAGFRVLRAVGTSLADSKCLFKECEIGLKCRGVLPDSLAEVKWYDGKRKYAHGSEQAFSSISLRFRSNRENMTAISGTLANGNKTTKPTKQNLFFGFRVSKRSVISCQRLKESAMPLSRPVLWCIGGGAGGPGAMPATPSSRS